MPKTKVFLAIPTTGTIVDSQVHMLREINDVYGHLVDLVYPAECVRRIFHDHARNKMVEEFLASDCEILWFLDSDVSPPIQILDLITMHKDKWEVAGAAYPVFMCHDRNTGPEQMVSFTAYHRKPDGGFTMQDVPKSGTGFIDGLATGCLFIKREVFDKVTAPYFEFKYNEKNRDIAEGEDLGFVRRCADLGIKFFTDYAMVCKHQKSVDLLDVNNYAIKYANNSILTYDGQIQAQIKSAMETMFNKGFEAGRAASAPRSKLVQSPQLWTP